MRGKICHIALHTYFIAHIFGLSKCTKMRISAMNSKHYCVTPYLKGPHIRHRPMTPFNPHYESLAFFAKNTMPLYGGKATGDLRKSTTVRSMLGGMKPGGYNVHTRSPKHRIRQDLVTKISRSDHMADKTSSSVPAVAEKSHFTSYHTETSCMLSMLRLWASRYIQRPHQTMTSWWRH